MPDLLAFLTPRRSWPVLLVLLVAGCDGLLPPRPPIAGRRQAESAEDAPRLDANFESAPSASPQPFGGDWEAWYVHRIGEQVVGLSHVSAATVPVTKLSGDGADDPQEVRFERTQRLLMRTGRVQFNRLVRSVSVETAAGALKRFETETQTGPLRTVVSGTVRGSSVQLKVTGEDAPQPATLESSANPRGEFAVEQALRRNQLSKNQSLRFQVVLPTSRQLGSVVLTSRGQASIPMLDGTFQVHDEFDVQTIDAEGTVVDQWIAWVDSQGSLVRTLRPALRLESLQVDRATAEALFGDHGVQDVHLVVSGDLEFNRRPKQLAFLLPASDDSKEASDESRQEPRPNPSASMAGMQLPTAPLQSLREAPGGLQILVADDAPPAGFSEYQAEPLPADRAATALIDLEHPKVQSAAARFSSLPSEVRVAEIAQYVKNSLSIAAQQPARPASAVLQSGRGGELDHAVVLASLLRKNEVPARIAFGVALPIQRDPSSGSGPLMMKLRPWVTAFVDGRWVVLDALTARRNPVDRLCLTICEGDADVQASWMDVFRRLPEYRIRLMGARYQD
ncbi:transglutaminase-like domain-containing protein [Roseiconus nitratireducens]|uniref:transglutaminase-like domain-containing protein n=1 Tax=Roseiconus nitratireducens TaxID=2605748 RepID=UPI001375F0B5|nr:transglutaminase family protein [Roseiconus nitratireducens]